MSLEHFVKMIRVSAVTKDKNIGFVMTVTDQAIKKKGIPNELSSKQKADWPRRVLEKHYAPVHICRHCL